MPIYQPGISTPASVGYTDSVVYSAVQAGGDGPPGATDDSANTSGNGYAGVGWYEGSMWTDADTGDVYTCLDATPNAAVWKKVAGPNVSISGSPWSPADAGFKAWSFDPCYTEGNATIVSGRLEFTRCRLFNPETITGVAIHIVTVGSTLTSGQNFAGIITPDGTRRGISADQTTDWAANTGLRSIPLTTPWSAPAGDFFVVTLSVGTTPPVFSRGSNSLGAYNGRLGATISAVRTLRSVATNLTTIPSTFDFQVSGTASGTALWGAAY